MAGPHWNPCLAAQVWSYAKKIPVASVATGNDSIDLLPHSAGPGVILSTPWTKSDRSAQHGRSPGSRVVASTAPSHP